MVLLFILFLLCTLHLLIFLSIVPSSSALSPRSFILFFCHIFTFLFFCSLISVNHILTWSCNKLAPRRSAHQSMTDKQTILKVSSFIPQINYTPNQDHSQTRKFPFSVQLSNLLTLITRLINYSEQHTFGRRMRVWQLMCVFSRLHCYSLDNWELTGPNWHVYTRHARLSLLWWGTIDLFYLLFFILFIIIYLLFNN